MTSATERGLLADVGYQPQSRELLTVWYSGPAEVDAVVLRAHLAERVAPAAVPAAFVYVPEFPLTPNGKIATEQLPPPRRVHRASASMYIAPSTSTEREISLIWQSILGIERVGVSESFFDLGGASLSALEMILRIGELFDVYIPEALAFTHRTVAELATEVDRLVEDAVARPRSVTDAPLTTTGNTLLSSSQEAMLYELRLDPDSPRYNVGHLFQVHGFNDARRLIDALRTVVERHDVLRTTLASPRTKLAVEAAIKVIEVQLDADDVDPWLRANMTEIFDLSSGPLVRAYMGMIGDDTLMHIVLPHIVCDASSIALMWAEIAGLIEDSELPAVRQYAAVTVRQRSSESLKADREFWLAHPGAELGEVALPLPRPGNARARWLPRVRSRQRCCGRSTAVRLPTLRVLCGGVGVDVAPIPRGRRGDSGGRRLDTRG